MVLASRMFALSPACLAAFADSYGCCCRRVAFNEWMLASIKKRTSIRMKDVFKLVVNKTYEGSERRLDGKFAFPASRLVTPNGHPNVDMQLVLADKFKTSYNLHERSRVKKPAGEAESKLESQLGALRKEEALLKATDSKSERLAEVWRQIRTLSEDLQDERERLQGKWLRGISFMGSNQREWATVKEVSYLEVGQRCGVDKGVVEAALNDMWHKFGAMCEAQPSMQQELLLSTGKLVVKDSKFYFVPKPIQADTIPGKDSLALTQVFASDVPKAGGSKALPKRPATSTGVSGGKLEPLKHLAPRGMTPLVNLGFGRQQTAPGADASAHSADGALGLGAGLGQGQGSKVGPAIMKRPISQAGRPGTGAAGAQRPGGGGGVVKKQLPFTDSAHQQVRTLTDRQADQTRLQRPCRAVPRVSSAHTLPHFCPSPTALERSCLAPFLPLSYPLICLTLCLTSHASPLPSPPPPIKSLSPPRSLLSLSHCLGLAEPRRDWTHARIHAQDHQRERSPCLIICRAISGGGGPRRGRRGRRRRSLGAGTSGDEFRRERAGPRRVLQPGQRRRQTSRRRAGGDTTEPGEQR